ncbi:MAG TPA: hypothetical protein VM674_02820 [Candidatus Acidoferrum sp.]|nr:hypothetical protein [Candidatus Acidoferrum sp.]
MTSSLSGNGAVRIGLRGNLGQFSLLVGVNALVGGMVGQERTILALMATKLSLRSLL